MGLLFVFWYCYQLHTGKADVSSAAASRERSTWKAADGTIDEYGDPVVPAKG